MISFKSLQIEKNEQQQQKQSVTICSVLGEE